MSITIRNLTVKPLQLKLVERFHEPEGKGGNVANATIDAVSSVAKNVTSIFSGGDNSGPERAQVEHDAKPYKHQDMDVRLEPFKITKTDVHKPDKDVVRLTLEQDGQRYRIDCPVNQDRSVGMTPLTKDPKHHFTAIYLPKHDFLAVYDTSHLDSWMRDMPDDVPISALSMPGTHNSPTCYRAPPSVRCQAVSPREQLDNGVRFFDLRVQIESPDDLGKDGLILVHSVFPISLTGTKYLRELTNEVQDFLKQHPSETVVISFKREGTGEGKDEQLGRILRDHYAEKAKDRWYTAPHIPLLKEARGKIVALRRFHIGPELKGMYNGKGWGINAETWADNTPNNLCPSGDVCVQDFYEVLETENIEKKIDYCCQHLDRAGACVCHHGDQHDAKKMPLYVNFLSASNFWKVGCWPEKIAAKINPATVDYLCRTHGIEREGKKVGDGGTGILVCDWVGNNGDWDLVRCIVGKNALLNAKRQGHC